MSSALQDIHGAILSGYNPQEFERLLRFELGKQLSGITSEANDMSQIVFDVLGAAERQNWTGDLVAAMKIDNPSNRDISELSSKTGGLMSTEYNGLSSQMRALSQDIYRLRMVVLGDEEIGNDGIIERLRSIESKIESISGEIQRIDSAVRALTSTVPHSGDDWMRRGGAIILIVTLASLTISLLESEYFQGLF